MFTAREILQRAGILLNDTGEYSDIRRWSLRELCDWLNDGLAAIALQKPSATARTVTLSLVPGVLQTIPEKYVSILRPVRNVRNEYSDRQPRRMITVVPEQQISSVQPDWHDDTYVYPEQQVKHFIFDEVNPRSYYVYPSNDGTGAVEMVLCEQPELIKPIAGQDDTRYEAYDVPVPIDDIYSGILLDYVLYRARSKDMQEAGSAQRAALHYQQFANALGTKLSAEANTSPNIKPGVPHGSSGVA